MSPFLVPPNERTSTPASAVVSRISTPSETAALEMRAPSMCRYMSSSCAVSAMAFDLVDRVQRAELGRLRDGDDRRLDVVDVAASDVGGADHLRGELAVRGRDVPELAAEEPLRSTALVPVDVRVLRCR